MTTHEVIHNIKHLAEQQLLHHPALLRTFIRFFAATTPLEVFGHEHLQMAREHLATGKGVLPYAAPHSGIFDPLFLVQEGVLPLAAEGVGLHLLASIKFFQETIHLPGIKPLAEIEVLAAQILFSGVELLPAAAPSIYEELQSNQNPYSQTERAVGLEVANTTNKNTLRRVKELLRGPNVVGLVPEGTRSRNRQVRSVPDAIGNYAKRTEALVLPLRLEGGLTTIQSPDKSGFDGLHFFQKGRVVIGEPLTYPVLNALASINKWCSGESLSEADVMMFWLLYGRNMAASPPADYDYGRYQLNQLNRGEFVTRP